MTANKRIAVNMIATYGRSVYGLVLGLFSTRWVLSALGKSDYGLFGVVGSLIIVIGFINTLFGSSVGRYYAYAIGEARNLADKDAHELLSRWFNAAVSIHLILPFALCVIGCPLGFYVIRHFLVVPPDRIPACDAVFMMALCAAFINMASVPYVSMYRAKQLIAELSIWGMVQTTLVFLGAFSLLRINSDRLVAYAAIMALVPSGIAIVQTLRARKQFNACHIVLRYMFDMKYISRLLSFALCEFFSCAGALAREQGTSLLINRSFGPTVNASWSISAQVSAQTTSLSSAMIGAISPELTSASGAGDDARLKSLTFSTCKFGVLLILLFAIPLILEMDVVLRLWLVEPPEHTATLCRCILCALIIHKLGWGHHMAVLADGRVARMQVLVGLVSTATVVLVWLAIRLGLGVLGVGGSFIISYFFLTLIRVYFAWRMLRISVLYWVVKIVLPLCVTAITAFAVGLIVVELLQESFCRILVTSLATFVVSCALGIFIVCDKDERVRAFLIMKHYWEKAISFV